MTRVIFELASGRDGAIQLRDCEFTERWKSVFKQNKPLGIRSDALVYARRGDVERKLRFAYSNKMKTEVNAIRSILSGIEAVRNLPLPWTRELPTYGMDWSSTNDIHRGFTTLTQTHCADRIELTHDEKEALMIEQYNFSKYPGGAGAEKLFQYVKSDIIPTYPSDATYSRIDFMREICKINCGVHDIEDRVRVSRRRMEIESTVFPEHEVCAIPKLDWQSKGSDGRSDEINIAMQLGDCATRSVDNNPYWNVYDLKNILGKDYLTAYYNYDDPGEWDICNHFQTTKGGFEIKPHMNDLVNQVLVPWVRDEWGYKPARAELISPIQIGHIDEQELISICTAKSGGATRNAIVKVDLVE